MAWLRRVLRHRGVLVLLGALAVVALAPFDPLATAMLFDLEFLAATAAVGLALLRGDGRLVLARLRSSHVVLILRAGLGLTRERPDTLLR